MSANPHVKAVIQKIQESRKASKAIHQARVPIRHITLEDGVTAELRLEIVTLPNLFLKPIL